MWLVMTKEVSLGDAQHFDLTDFIVFRRSFHRTSVEEAVQSWFLLPAGLPGERTGRPDRSTCPIPVCNVSPGYIAYTHEDLRLSVTK